MSDYIDMWIYLIAILLGICFASLLYLSNKSQHYNKTLSILLFLLRTIAVALVVILFFNPYIKQKSTKIEAASIIVVQDNSKSLILTKDSSFYKNEYPHILDSLINKLDDYYNVDKYLFGKELKDFQHIDYQDYYTDLYTTLNDLRKIYYKKNVGAVVLLSDGIINKSYSPEQNIESYPFPIYTVTLGDTTNHPDFYVKDVQYNKTSPTNTIFPLRIIANAHNCRNKSMNIKVLVNNEIIEELNIPVNSNRFSHTFDFNINSGEEGVKQIDILIDTIRNEQVTQNNKKSFFIEVIDKQYKVLFYAKSPHPDLGSLKNALGNHFETEMFFDNGEIPDFSDYDIIFMHQIPYKGMNRLDQLKQEVANNKETPLFFIIGEHTDLEAFNSLQNSISIERGTVNSILDVKPYHSQTFGLYSIEDELIKSINNLPPLSVPHINYSFKTNHDILLLMNISNVMTQNPMMSFSNDTDGRKVAFLLGTGIWRWKLYDYYNNENCHNFEELFSKSVKYLLTEKDKELIINHKDNYLNTEDIIFTADLKNPSQELITDPDLHIRIINKHNKAIYEYAFSKNDKSYKLNINTLPEGIYTFTAQAEYGGKKYMENGTFSVVSVGAEAQDLIANASRMQALANLTKAKNYNINELDQLLETLKNDERICSITREENNYKDLINLKSIFFIILSLISIEWILRKMFGTY